MPNEMKNIYAVVVTYNRPEYLEQVLTAYDKMKVLPKGVIVVDNASDAPTKTLLAKWASSPSAFEKHVITNPENEGGAGGFYTGIVKALELEADWIMLADDDAIPHKDFYEKMQAGYSQIKEEHPEKPISALCSSMMSSGILGEKHRRTINIGKFTVNEIPVPASEYEKAYFRLDLLTFVGACINVQAIRKIGLPEKDYFIFYDDTEYSYRLNLIGKIYCIPAAIMDHKAQNIGSGARVTWKTYYSQRNKLSMLKKHFPARYSRFSSMTAYILRASIISKLLNRYTEEERALVRAAIADAKNDNLGVSKKYYPGWLPDGKKNDSGTFD